MPDKKVINEVSRIIYDGFLRYNKLFHKITRRAGFRFERCDWQGHQKDVVRRVNLYETSVKDVISSLKKYLDKRVDDRALWSAIQLYFGKRLDGAQDAGFAKTFFNSVTRRIFRTLGMDPQLEFIAQDLSAGSESLKLLNLKRYLFWGSTEKIFKDILRDFKFKVPYEKSVDLDIIRFAESRLNRKNEYLRFEFIDSFFYQATRAYLVGRIVTSDKPLPLVIAFKNTGESIIIDAVLTSSEEVSNVFTYTRSYYFADPNSVVGAVHFIHSILPKKPIDELYTVLGRLRQGKTERYRIFTEHLKTSADRFIHAEGDVGLVMIVFTLPSYNLVFKIIRDKFGYPKNITRSEVIEKYKLISKHDRAGRLIDTQEFLNLEIPINRFSDQLVAELVTEASQTVAVVDDLLLIRHVYIERRVRPLNLYINEASTKEVELAVFDYGHAIKDLAQTNIFPGDLLLKNFGVTRHGRVLYYDYDEVSLVTQCNFREIPRAQDDADELRADSWYYVGESDVFPEEFIKFLSMNQALREFFLANHGELLTAHYWRNIKSMHEAGEVSLVVPYRTSPLPIHDSIAV